VFIYITFGAPWARKKRIESCGFILEEFKVPKPEFKEKGLTDPSQLALTEVHFIYIGKKSSQ